MRDSLIAHTDVSVDYHYIIHILLSFDAIHFRCTQKAQCTRFLVKGDI